MHNYYSVAEAVDDEDDRREVEEGLVRVLHPPPQPLALRVLGQVGAELVKPQQEEVLQDGDEHHHHARDDPDLQKLLICDSYHMLVLWWNVTCMRLIPWFEGEESNAEFAMFTSDRKVVMIRATRPGMAFTGMA